MDVNAKFLSKMIWHPDLLNAPMTHWLAYLSLFDFQINHIPAILHQGLDGLLQRQQTLADSNKSDTEEFLNKAIGVTLACPLSPLPYSNLHHGPFHTLSKHGLLQSNVFKCIHLEICSLPDPPLASFMLMTLVKDMVIFDSFPFVHEEVILGTSFFSGNFEHFDPSIRKMMKNKFGSIFHHSFLKFTDNFSFTSHDFFLHSVSVPTTLSFLFGDDVVELKVTDYHCVYQSHL